MTFLTLIPCTDFKSTQSEEKLSVEASHNHEHTGDCDDYGNCTPFCMCICCSINAIISTWEFKSDYGIVVNTALLHKLYTDMETTPYHNILFHPPLA